MDLLTKSMVQNNLLKLRDINQQEDVQDQVVKDSLTNQKRKDMIDTQAKYRRRVSTLFQYMPQKSHKSGILSDLQISNLISELPMYYQTSNWKRLFNIDVDGCSLITFFQRNKEYDTTIMII